MINMIIAKCFLSFEKYYYNSEVILDSESHPTSNTISSRYMLSFIFLRNRRIWYQIKNSKNLL